MADYLTYQNIYEAVCRRIGDSAQSRLVEVQDVINSVYLNEVCNCDELYPLHWLCNFDDTVKSKTRATISAISKAASASVTATAHGLVTDDLITIYGVVGMVEVNNRTFRITKTSADAFTLSDLEGNAVASTAYTTYSSGGYAYHRGVTLATTGRSIQRILKGTVRWDGDSYPLTPVGPFGLEDSGTDLWMESLGCPSKYMHKKFYATSGGTEVNQLLWFWLPDDAYRLRYWCEIRPARLSSASDTPQLPAMFHDTLITGACCRLLDYGPIQVENAVLWPGLYKAQLGAIKQYNFNWWRQYEQDTRSGLFLP